MKVWSIILNLQKKNMAEKSLSKFQIYIYIAYWLLSKQVESNSTLITCEYLKYICIFNIQSLQSKD